MESPEVPSSPPSPVLPPLLLQASSPTTALTIATGLVGKDENAYSSFQSQVSLHLVCEASLLLHFSLRGDNLIRYPTRISNAQIAGLPHSTRCIASEPCLYVCLCADPTISLGTSVLLHVWITTWYKELLRAFPLVNVGNLTEGRRLH